MIALKDFVFLYEMALTSTPRTASPSYTDLSAYLLSGFQLSRGRSNEFTADAQPSSATAVLINTDARFTMNNGSSPYAPLQIRRPCRWRVTYSGTTYPLWQGFNDNWGNGRDQNQGRATLSISDRMARAAKIKMKSAILAELFSDGPDYLYPLTDPAGSLVASDFSGNGRPSLSVAMTGTGAVSLGVGVGAGPDPVTLAAFTPGGGSDESDLVDLTGFVAATSTTVTVEAYLRPAALTTGRFVATDVNASGIGLYMDGAGHASALSNTPAITLVGTSVLSSNSLSHVAVVCNAGTATLYVNGFAEATTGYTSTPLPVQVSYVGRGGYSGQVSHVAVYRTALSAARILDHANARSGWTGETTNVRFSRYCRQAGLPSGSYSAPTTGLGTMGAHPTNGISLLDSLKAIADAENGVVYASAAGVLTLGVRSARYKTAVGLTLDATKPGQVEQRFTLNTEDSLLLNDYAVTRPGGSTQRSIDQTSIDAFDLHDQADTLFYDTDDQALQATTWGVAANNTPQPRSDSITVDVVAFANGGGNVAQLLQADVGTRMRITNMSTDILPTGTIDLFIEGVKPALTGDKFTISFLTSPVGLYDKVFVLDDATFGQLDSGNVLAL